MLNELFCSMSDIEGSADQPPPVDAPVDEEELREIPLTETEVTTVLKSLQCDKACGSDLIGNRVLKTRAEASAKFLTKLFNYSLTRENAYTMEKSERDADFQKRSEGQTWKLDRPVSLLPCMSKALECCIQNRLMPYLETNNRLTPNQSAFSDCSSTVTQLLELVDMLGRSLDKQKISSAFR